LFLNNKSTLRYPAFINKSFLWAIGKLSHIPIRNNGNNSVMPFWSRTVPVFFFTPAKSKGQFVVVGAHERTSFVMRAFVNEELCSSEE
jgi:hypothetical protein